MTENVLIKTKQFYQKIIFGVGAAFSLVLVVYLGVIVFQMLTPPSLSVVIPKDQSTSVSPIATVSFIFDRPLSSVNRNHVSISPASPNNILIVNNTLTIYPIPAFPLGQKISITLTDPTSTAGKIGKTVSISFTTKSRDSLTISELHQVQFAADQQLGQQIQQASKTPEFQKASAINNLIQSCPYETNDFLVQYIQAQEMFQIRIKQNPYSTIKQEAINWIKSMGITDLSWVNLEFASAPGVVPQ